MLFWNRLLAERSRRNLEERAVMMAQRMVHAAVKIYDKRQEKEIIIPCHRHCDVFVILKECGYSGNLIIFQERSNIGRN